MSLTQEEGWFLGSMNDGLCIIDKPPRPSTDDIWHEWPDGPNLVIPISSLPQHIAQQIVDAHNEAMDAAWCAGRDAAAGKLKFDDEVAAEILAIQSPYEAAP